MHTKTTTLLLSLLLLSIVININPTFADNEHGGQIFHAFMLEADVGESREGTLSSWDFDGWIGGDYDKLWLKSEGEILDNETESAEFWVLYSHNIAEFWDTQIGIRHDTDPLSTTYLAFGIDGLARYFFETEAHIFISDEGDVSARLRQENDFLLTQQLILKPYFEVNLSAQDVSELEVGSGVTDGMVGLQTRYEISRKFAPYIDLHYDRLFGGTSSLAKQSGQHNDDFIAAVGLMFMF